ncbi:MAG: biotin--[acetyl-CoA-carboxylase] ligase, partial [Alphaproteobacteria bacterium]|nr:biotin--[acetyl-CoA-carboxylase] ligase [Alphaproteobacteria bacterium]
MQQTAGRGRLGRGWTSPVGNLYASLLLRPGVPPQRAAELSLLAGVAACEAIARQCPVPVLLKWPNDLMRGDGKLGGILVESALDPARATVEWVVIGIGLNLVPVAVPGREVADLADHAVDRTQLLADLVTAIDAWVQVWLREGLQPVLSHWTRRIWGMGRTVQAGSVSGVILGLDRDGALLVTTATGPVRVTAGDVGVGGGVHAARD